MTMDYWELNKIVSLSIVPDIATILYTLAMVLGIYRAVLDSAHALF